METSSESRTKLKAIISPSILSCDFSNLGAECEKVIECGADWLHIDVMDGVFVPNFTIGMPVIESLRKRIKDAFFDVHCMIVDPLKYLEEFAKSGANQMTVHLEIQTESLETVLIKIRENGMRAGIAINPETPVTEYLTNLIDKNLVDMVLVMSVRPGFGGQKFMEEVLPKVRQLRKSYPNLDIQMDGGIKCENVEKCAEAGANIIVSGTGIIAHEDPKYAIKFMRDVLEKNL